MEITGRVVADATVRTTKTDKKVTGFTIAMNRSYRPKDGDRVTVTTYIECAYWRNAGIAPYLTKGTLVALSGNMSASAYINKQGRPVGTLTFTPDDINLLTKGNADITDKAKNNTGSITEDNPPYTTGAAADDDLPF